jgi:hypothetical protein
VSKGDNNTPDANTRLEAAANAVFLWSLASGFLLIGISILDNKYNLIEFVGNNMVLAAGIGLLLFAFGTRAVLKVSGLVIAGAGAVAAAAFLGLMYYTQQEYVIVDITGPGLSGTQMTAGATQNFVGALQGGNRYRFVVFRSDTNKASFDITIDQRDATGAVKSEQIFDCIPIENLKNYLGTGVTLDWRITAQFDRITSPNTKTVNFVSGASNCGGAPPAPGANFSALFLGKAFAQTPPADIAAEIKLLSSDSIQARRDARLALSAMGLPMVRPMLDAMRTDDYQLQLGGTVALTLYLRDNKPLAAQVEAAMNADDFALLVKLSSSQDRTLRIYASEFLFDLGSPLSIAPAVARIEELRGQTPRNDDGIYNIILVLKGAYPRAADDQKAAIKQELTGLLGQIGDKTDKLIHTVLP